MAAAKLQQLNQMLLVKVQRLQEEREQDVRDLQERIDYLEKRESKLLAEVQLLQRVREGEGVAVLLEENQKLKDMVDELEKLLATQELHFEERERALTAQSREMAALVVQGREKPHVERERALSAQIYPEIPPQTTPPRKKLGRARQKVGQVNSMPPSLDDLSSFSGPSLEELPQTPTTPSILITPIQTTPPATPQRATPPVEATPGLGGSFKLNWCPEQFISVKMVRGQTAHDTSTGEIYFSCSRSPFIHTYHPDSGKWTRLQPPCPHLFFGMTLVRGRVTAVGGQKGPLITSAVMTLVEDGGEGEGRQRSSWQQELPPMPTQRFNLTTLTVGEGSGQEKVLAVGGLSQNGTALACVEVLSVGSGQWSSVASLPRPADMLCSCLADNQLYLLGASNTRRVYTCYLPYLLQTTPSQTLEVWFQLPDTPTNSPTGIVLGDQLLVVGGFDERGVDSTKVFHFQQQSRTWHAVSRMNTACNKPLLATLPDSRLMVVGGSTKVNHMMNVVQIANVTHVHMNSSA